MVSSKFFELIHAGIFNISRKLINRISNSRFVLWLFELRYSRYKNNPALSIGFLRLYNEENTIIPCLMSVDYMFDKIVVIYSDITDNSLNLLKDYIQKNKLQDKYIIKKYPYNVYPPHSEAYFSSPKFAFSKFGSQYKHTLAAYYEFGFEICKKLAKGKNGFVAKIDADQIYFPNCFLKISSFMEADKYAHFVNSYGGFDGHICDDNKYKIDYSHSKAGLNGFLSDHIIIPFSMINFTYFTMNIRTKPHKIAWEVTKNPFIKLTKLCNSKYPMWFHFDRKRPYKPVYLMNLSQIQKSLYLKYIYPLLVKSGSPYQTLNID